MEPGDNRRKERNMVQVSWSPAYTRNPGLLSRDLTEAERRLEKEREEARKRAQLHQDIQRGSVARRREQQQADIQQGLIEAEYEQRTQMELAKLQEKARLDAQQWDYEYTPKQRQQIAALNQAAQDFANNPDVSEEERKAGIAQIEQQIVSMRPHMKPKEGPTYPDGQGVGDVWTNNQGDTVTRDENGIPKLLQRYTQSQAWHEQEVKSKQELELFKLRVELATKPIDVWEADENGVPQRTGSRNRTPEEINAVMNVIRDDMRQQDIARNTLSPIEGELVVPPELQQQMQQRVVESGIRGIKEPDYVRNARQWAKGGSKFVTGESGYQSGQMSQKKAKKIIADWEEEIQNLPKNLPHISSDADWERLPVGAAFIDPEGNLRRK